MLDESLLDAPEALARADTRGLLRGAAESGARVRTAARHAAEAGIGDLKPDGRPRAVMVAGPGAAGSCTADLLGALSGGNCPVSLIVPTGVAPAPGALRWALPGWAGPLDLLVLATPDGTEPGLPRLVEQAYRRGCAIVAVAPDRSPLADAVAQARGLMVPLATASDNSAPYATGGYGTDPYRRDPLAPGVAEEDAALAEGALGDAPAPYGTPSVPQPVEPPGTAPDEMTGPALPGTLWALLTPLLLLVDRIGLVSAPPTALQQVADRLDQVAERCGPAIATYTNPAKTLAAELAGALPLLWTEGPVAAATGRRFSGLLAALAGRPALVAELPGALAAHGALLTGAFAGGADPDDFFRDRVDEPEALRARIVLLHDEPVGPVSAVPTARELALAHETAFSELEPAEGTLLESAAELLAITDFAAVYLALASADRT
ncbi:SIS domain-containing protein [Streptomyces solisilvae]|uniref:SIS domain-containing protein n=1 Tax=Streptomyces malaysiensis TaxID=92644 RepID=UPI0011CEC18E|nr:MULTISPECIES: SIS domain-containing protein [unclassified Streptomyces]MCC4318113.1 mannose-6-phosphate isomerase [Streptomyces malaysiensis]MCM3812981.1 mannose-6-phosphate isomerase [Streptomyces sp. DR7-3]MCQ6249842.1 mannose-6-phosphate isomerase [Streptomyces malaysiensis]WHX20560.1 SIS domain-containing protein [Streptomyces sp. NA07423]